MNHENDLAMYRARRDSLVQAVKDRNDDHIGSILLLGNLDQEHGEFRQEGNFYYFTGIKEPGLALLIDVSTGYTRLYYPQYTIDRAVWMEADTNYALTSPDTFGVDEVCPMGAPFIGYQTSFLFEKEQYANLINQLLNTVTQGEKIGVCWWRNKRGDVHQQLMLERIDGYAKGRLSSAYKDISLVTGSLRRIKQENELALLRHAISVTIFCQRAAAKIIKPGSNEKIVQILIEGIMRVAGCELSFPSIVGGGKNSTVLHYNANKSSLQSGDLVVVDIGASYNLYCADITRTFPVSGRFSPRQQEIYQIVLDTQEYIAGIAKPGMWLNYGKNPEQSLNHLARTFLKKAGYDRYFPHGIGHFLGIDTHDVGDYSVPLQEGDVFTIEPGIYIPEEKIGVRIEDNYCITSTGADCLSGALEKSPQAICQMMSDATQESATFEYFLECAYQYQSKR